MLPLFWYIYVSINGVEMPKGIIEINAHLGGNRMEIDDGIVRISHTSSVRGVAADA